MRIFLLLLLLALLLPATLPAQEDWPRTDQACLTPGQDAYDRREYEEARAWALEELEKDPLDLDAVRIFVMAVNEMNAMYEVEEMFTQEDDDPDLQGRTHYARGWAGVLIRDYDLAQEELEKAGELLGEDNYEIELASLIAARNGRSFDTDEILERYRLFLEKHPGNGRAYLSYLNALNIYDPDSEQAKRIVEEALAAPEVMPETYIRAIDSASRDFWYDPKEGLETLRKGLVVYPRASEIGIHEIRHLRKLGRLQEALERADYWLEVAPNRSDLVIEKMYILADMTRYEDAAMTAGMLEDIRWRTGEAFAAPLHQARLYHLAGMNDKAIELLEKVLKERPEDQHTGGFRNMLYLLYTRGRDKGVSYLPRRFVLEQRGNYCGPATLQTILRYWGIEKTQEEIADRVYTGIAGTPPEVIHSYVESLGLESIEFVGDEETWKDLIDAGYPILWLQMYRSGGGHYRTVVGYDDVFRDWMTVDPNYYMSDTRPFEAIEDTWILPSVRRSIVIFPKDQAGDPVLAGLGPTPFLLISNWAMYIATGSNLFVDFVPALLLNSLVLTLLGILLSILIRSVSYPNVRLRRRYILAAVFGVVIPISILVGLLRNNEAVSLLLGVNLALLTMIPLLLLILGFRYFISDYLHPRETVGMCVLVTLVWSILSFVDQQPWETWIPVGVFVIGLPVVLYPRLRVMYADRFARRGDLMRALDIVRPCGQDGMRYFAGLIVELESLIASGSYHEVAPRVETALASRETWPRNARQALELYKITALTLQQPNEETRIQVGEYLNSVKSPAVHRTAAEGLLLYLDALLQSHEAAAVRNAQDIDGLLNRLNTLSPKYIPGLPIRPAGRQLALHHVSFFLALAGALRLARTANDTAREEALRETWCGRHALLFGILREVEGASVLEDHPSGPSDIPSEDGLSVDKGPVEANV